MISIIRKIFLFFYWNYRNFKDDTRIFNYNVSHRLKIGKKTMIRKGTEIRGNVELGDYSYISGPNTYVKDAIIGKHCSIARNVIIGVAGHNYNWVTTGAIIVSQDYKFIKSEAKVLQKDTPIIGNDVWIGMNSMIMRGVKIGDGAVIAAGSIVTKDVEAYSIVGGIPAKHIKYRFTTKQIQTLLKIQWWNWSDENIKMHIDSFYDIETFINEHLHTEN